jgi:aspartate aminotransferase
VSALSPTLAINEAVRLRQARGERVVHLGFGEAGLPVHPLLREALERSSGANAYGAVAGSAALRSSVAAYYARRGLETEPEQVLAGPGSKALLYAVLTALGGDLVLPRPAWVSYEPQARLAGKQVLRLDIPAEAGGVPDPELLGEGVSLARKRGLDPRILLLTHPDNPTGTFANADLLESVLDVARECGLQVVADEIYAELAHAPSEFVSAARIDSEVVLTGGLSKSHALGGWRVGVLRAPASDIGRRLLENVKSVGSEVWSCLAAPIDAAAAAAYDEPPELVEFVGAARTLHRVVARAAFDVVAGAGLACRPPTAAFYLYPDFAPMREQLGERGIATSAALAEHLLDQFAVAVLPGSAFGDDTALTVRMATSLLYGESEPERWESLSAGSEAAEHPRVGFALETLGGALRTLGEGHPVSPRADSQSRTVAK